VVVVLKSRKQGTGKTTLGWVMVKIFGPRHGALVDDKERLTGRFTDWLEQVSFILAEEIMWARDHKTADKLKSLITGDTMQIERKYSTCRQIPNRLHVMMTTNHDHAIPAGVGDRRYFVLDVSDEHACDKAWFGRLYQDLNNGGTGEFLDFLQSLQLGDWHPREMLKTAEATEQQRMSADSPCEWAQACIDADAIIGGPSGTALDLGRRISTELLREAYTGYCKQHGLYAGSVEAFGKACVEMFGPRQRLKVQQDHFGHKSSRRPWGYDVPDGNTWPGKLDARLGIK
jgi:phage/plasmid-associated DNA primase